MKIYRKNIEELFLPDYVIRSLQDLDWFESDKDTLSFYPDDILMIHYGTRGSTSYTGPKFIRYGANTTSYQIFSPKLPSTVAYLGDGGSGILEASQIIIDKLLAMGVNPFTDSKEKVSEKLQHVLLSFTHYHYDHLHLGLPLAGFAHTNKISKQIIGADNPRVQIRQAFKRPYFPRDFGEISSSYNFFELKDPRSLVIIYLPNGDFKSLDISNFEDILQHHSPQIKHKGTSYNLEDCLVVRLYPLYHPDPCNSFRYENYSEKGERTTAVTFMTDHETQDTHAEDNYFIKQTAGSDYLYIDGQYDEENYVSGFGHGRVEVIARVAAKLNLPFVGIGHHDPSRMDTHVDKMIQKAKDAYKETKPDGTGKIIGASDRMLVFIPDKKRGRNGVVFGRMDVDIGDPAQDEIGEQNSLQGNYKKTDLTSIYSTHDETTSL